VFGVGDMGIWWGAGTVAMRGTKGWPRDEPRESFEKRDDEPLEASERGPAVYYAPRGECEYCDRRRAAAARSMRRVREREG
jgi:hypothetical protein